MNQCDFNTVILHALFNLGHIKPAGREQNIGWAPSSSFSQLEKYFSDRVELENNSGGFHSSNNAVQAKTTRPQSLI